MSDAELLLLVESRKKSGWLAAFLNVIVPGAGYAYCGNWVLGAVAFLIVPVLILVTLTLAFYVFAPVLFIDGFLAANRYNKNLIRDILAERATGVKRSPHDGTLPGPVATESASSAAYDRSSRNARSVQSGDVPTQPTRECPHCAETVVERAIVCKHCGRELHSSGDAVGTPAKTASNSPHSCPKCGAPRPNASAQCACGYLREERRTRTLDESIEVLENLLSQTRLPRSQSTGSFAAELMAEIARELRFTKSRHSDNPDVRRLIGELETASAEFAALSARRNRRRLYAVVLAALVVVSVGAFALHRATQTSEQRLQAVVLSKYGADYRRYKASGKYRTDSIAVLTASWQIMNAEYGQDSLRLREFNDAADRRDRSLAEPSELRYASLATTKWFDGNYVAMRALIDTGRVFNKNWPTFFYLLSLMTQATATDIDSRQRYSARSLEYADSAIAFAITPFQKRTYLDFRAAQYGHGRVNDRVLRDIQAIRNILPDSVPLSISEQLQQISAEVDIGNVSAGCESFSTLKDRKQLIWTNVERSNDKDWVRRIASRCATEHLASPDSAKVPADSSPHATSAGTPW